MSRLKPEPVREDELVHAHHNSWKVTLPCTRAEAEMLNGDVPALTLLDNPPVIMTEELIPFDDAAWHVQAFFEGEPEPGAIALLQSLLPSAVGFAPVLEQLPDEDWVTLSQQAIDPVHAGGFYVHTSSNKGEVPQGAKPFLIEASRAFGTGSHETTAGCLKMLSSMKSRGTRFDHVADIGTGTGLLAFAALHLWPRACATASDIDAVSIEVCAANAIANGVTLGRGAGQVALAVASGTDHSVIRARAPYDLLIANILAGPLIELAPSFAAVMQDGGTLILAGLLSAQCDAVMRAYRRAGFRLAEREDSGDWPCLKLVKRRQYRWMRPVRASGHTTQGEGDFGTW